MRGDGADGPLRCWGRPATEQPSHAFVHEVLDVAWRDVHKSHLRIVRDHSAGLLDASLPAGLSYPDDRDHRAHNASPASSTIISPPGGPARDKSCMRRAREAR